MASEAAHKQLLAQAQAAEKRSDFEGAAALYARAGALEDAARLYLAAGKFLEAGRLLLTSIGYDRKRTANLEPNQRKAALKAAICFGRAGDVGQAVDLYLVLGERMRAVELLRTAGDHVNAARVERATGRVDLIGYSDPSTTTGSSERNDVITLAGAQALEKAGKLDVALEAYAHLKLSAHAARVAEVLGKTSEAAAFHLQANQPLEAGLCFARVGDKEQALKMLVQVPREHPRYREGCVEAVRAANDLDRLDFQLDNLIGKFLSGGPESDAEADAFYNLGALYARHGVPENARECYRKLAVKRPDYRDVAERLRVLDAGARGSTGDIAKVFAEEESFRQAVDRHRTPVSHDDSFGEYELPELPDLPDMSGTGAPAHGNPPAAAGRAATVVRSGNTPASEMTPLPSGTVARGSGRRLVTPAPIDPRAGRVMTPMPVDPITGRLVTPPPIDSRTGRATPHAAPPAALTPRPARFATTPPLDVSTRTGTPERTMAPSPVDAHSAPMKLTEGMLINSRYRLEKKIGQGGMGAVYQATDNELDEVMAIKFLSAAAADDGMIQRFKQEVSLSRQLNHPNIIRLYDLGSWGELKYITMELLSGRDLSKMLGSEAMNLDMGLGIMVQACSALQAVHDRGIIHRDIKPENFFVTDDGVLKVMDFGIAKRHDAGKRLTRAGMMAGTPQYMSPEQINDFASATKLADLYSLGIIAYQVFTGTVPFDNEELMPILVAHLTTAPEPPTKRNSKIPPELESIILKLLAKKPADRIQSCREVAGDLARIRVQLAVPGR